MKRQINDQTYQKFLKIARSLGETCSCGHPKTSHLISRRSSRCYAGCYCPLYQIIQPEDFCVNCAHVLADHRASGRCLHIDTNGSEDQNDWKRCNCFSAHEFPTEGA